MARAPNFLFEEPEGLPKNVLRQQLCAACLDAPAVLHEMLIGRDDISNGVITLGACLSMFVYIRACFHFMLISENLRAQLTGGHRGIGGGIQIPET